MPTDEFSNMFDQGWAAPAVGFFTKEDPVADYGWLDMPKYIKQLEKQIAQAQWYTHVMANAAKVSSVPFPGSTPDEPVPDLTAEMFEDAIEHIRQHGWTQGEDVNRDDGRVCTQGAFGLWAVTNDNPLGIKAVTHNRQRYLAFYHHNNEVAVLMGIDLDLFGSVVAWNDYPDRTEAEVIDALTLAAKKLRDAGR